MTFPTNILQQVVTYNRSGLALLQNQNCFVATANTKFKDFQNLTANLGQTVNFDLPPKAISSVGLVANFQAAAQRYQSLTCDQAWNVSFEWSTQQFIYNVEDYISVFAKSYIAELSAKIETTVAQTAISGVPVMTVNNQNQTVPTGALHTESGPYRYFTAGFTGTTVTPISTVGQLAEMEAYFMEPGSPTRELNVYLSNMSIPAIINSSLAQFVPTRNEEFANSWDLGTYKGSTCHYYRSNLLPIQYAGYAGDNDLTLTLTATDDATGANITQLTFSSPAANQTKLLKAGDILRFQDGVSGHPNMRYVTFFGHTESASKVDVRVLADADSSGGSVTVSIYPALCSQQGNINQNLNRPLEVGMTVKSTPTHRAGLVTVPDSLYIAMPRLNSQEPFPTSVETDSETGVSVRQYWGTLFGQNAQGMVHDAILGVTGVPEYQMRLILPV